MLIKDADIQNVLTTAGFIVEGLLSFDIKNLSDYHQEGCIGLITEATSYAPHLERLWNIGYDYLNHHKGQPSGVWPYAVVAPFGAWFGAVILRDREVPEELEVRKYLLNSTLAYMLDGNDFNEEQMFELSSNLNYQHRSYHAT